jgi:dienelactone hydrolase
MKLLNTTIFAALTLGTLMTQANTVKTIEYGSTEKFEGVLVTPKNATNKTPGILLIHNWLGISDETKFQAQRYADLGYTVMAVDVYGKGIRPKSPEEAGALAGKYKADRKLLREHLNLAYKTLIEQKNVDKSKIAVMGYCFGGTAAIELARSGADLKGTLSFHGGLDAPNPTDGKNIKGKLVAFHGAIDPFVKEVDLKAFEDEMKTNNINYQLIKYAGAVHSFTDKTAGTDIKKGAAYNEAADLKSFAAAKDFLKDVLR